MVSSTPRPYSTSGKDPVPILQEAGWAPGPVWTGGKSRPQRDSIPDRPAPSHSLYRLSYPAHTFQAVNALYKNNSGSQIHTKIYALYVLKLVLRTATTRLQKLKITSSLKAKPKELFETRLFHAYEIYFPSITGFLVCATVKFHRQLRMRSRGHNCNTTLNHRPTAIY